MNIVVVEDHQSLREILVSHMLLEGFAVDGVSCGEELDEIIAQKSVNLLILDVNLPGESGFDIAHRIRRGSPDIFIIMLTVQDEERDRIQGYRSGADMYLAKPTSPGELTAAVRALQRRWASSEKGDVLVLNIPRMVLITHEGEIAVSKPDIALIKALALAPERQLPYWRLFEVTERSSAADESKGQLEMQIYRLRKKLIERGVADGLFKAIRGEGYQLMEAVLIRG